VAAISAGRTPFALSGQTDDDGCPGMVASGAPMKRSGNDLETLDVAQSTPRVDEDVEEAGAACAVERTSVIGLLRLGARRASSAFFI